MTIEEAISFYEESERINKELAEQCESATAKNHNLDNAEKCRQMIAWLRELQECRKAPEIVRCGACVHFQCNMRFDGSVPKGADAYECRHWCGGCDPMDYCSYGERAERRTEDDSITSIRTP